MNLLATGSLSKIYLARYAFKQRTTILHPMISTRIQRNFNQINSIRLHRWVSIFLSIADSSRHGRHNRWYCIQYSG